MADGRPPMTGQAWHYAQVSVPGRGTATRIFTASVSEPDPGPEVPSLTLGVRKRAVVSSASQWSTCE